MFEARVEAKGVEARIGVQIEGRAVDQVRWIGRSSWVVYRVRWNECEEERGRVIWPEAVMEDLEALQDWPVMIRVQGCPEWARLVPEARCSAPRRAEDFAKFARAVAERFRPWAISVGNEPEVRAEDAVAAGLDDHLGGFGNELARHYGKVVKKTWQGLKGLPVRVAAGELMLMDGGAFWREARRKCSGFYDYVAYHAYAQHPAQFGVVQQRAAVLRATGERKALICSETHYLAPTNGEPGMGFDETQAEYLRFVFANRGDVERVAVYAMQSGWRMADLVRSGTPRPCYEAYRGATG